MANTHLLFPRWTNNLVRAIGGGVGLLAGLLLALVAACALLVIPTVAGVHPERAVHPNAEEPFSGIKGARIPETRPGPALEAETLPP